VAAAGCPGLALGSTFALGSGLAGAAFFASSFLGAALSSSPPLF